MKRITAFGIVLILLLSLLLPGCTSDKMGQVLVVGTPVHNGMYNYLYAATVYDQDVCNLIYEGLVDLSPDGIPKINSRLVEEFAIADDGLEYTFTLKEGILFSDGSPLTADDVVFTYQTLADPSSTAYHREVSDNLKGGPAYSSGRSKSFVGVEAVGERTVVFHFLNKQRINLEMCSMKIISKNYYPDWAYGNADFAMMEKIFAPMGSGPYLLAEYKSDKQAVLRLNPQYWAKAETDYKIDTIMIKFFSNVELKDGLISGEIDFVPDLSDRDMLRELRLWQTNNTADSFEYINYSSNRYGYLGFNTEGSFTKSANLRRAMAFGFNREKFVEDYFVGAATRTDLPVPIGDEILAQLDVDIEHYEYNVEKAKEILEEFNYRWDDDGQMYLVDDKVVLNLLVVVEDPVADALVAQFLEDMKVLGIEINVEYMTYGEIWQRLRLEVPNSAEESEPSGQWNLFFMEMKWFRNDPWEWAEVFGSAGIPNTNVTKYYNGDVDSLLVQGALKTDLMDDKTTGIYSQVLAHLNADLPELPLYNRQYTAVENTQLQGLSYGAYERWSHSIENVSYKEEIKEKKS